MSAKQTAVQWLNRWVLENPFAKFGDYTNAVKQALAMEREQIVEAFQCEWSPHNCSGSHYYENTYGKEAQP